MKPRFLADADFNQKIILTPLKPKRLRKYWLTPGTLVLLVCILANTSANAQDNNLATAAERGDLSRVRELMAAKQDVNARDAEGKTALINASTNGHLETVRMMNFERGFLYFDHPKLVTEMEAKAAI